MQRLSFTIEFLITVMATILSTQADAGTPQMVSLNPSSGSGLTQTFTLTVSDSAGASDISSIDMLLNSSFNTQQESCWIYYGNTENVASLAGDGGTFGNPNMSPGQTQQNTQCSVEFVSSSASGNNVSVTFNITFASGWLGAKIVWGESLDQEGDDSGYQQVGTYNASTGGPSPDFSVSVTPNSQNVTPGNTVTYNVTLTSINGFSGNVVFGPITVSPQLSGMIVSVASGGEQNSTYITVPANGTGTGTITVSTTASTPPGNDVTIIVNFSDDYLQHSFQATLMVVSPPPPAAPTASLSPASGSGSTQTFTISATDPNGFQAITGIDFLMNSTLNGVNGCWLYYSPESNLNSSDGTGTIYLASDDTTNWNSSTTVTPDLSTAQTIQNSQCGVFGGPTTVSGSGNTLTLTVTLTFSSSFAGPKLVYLQAADQSATSGYQQEGTWTAVGGSGAPDFSVGVTPDNVQTIQPDDKVAYIVTVRAYNNYSGNVTISVGNLPPGSTVTPPTQASENGYTSFVLQTSASTPSGTYTLAFTGTDGTLTHSTNVALIVTTATINTLSASPNSGSGASQNFTFSAGGQGGTSNASGLDVLFNTTENGTGACWMYYDGGNLWLASDDGSVWASTTETSPGVLSNSQCTLSSFQYLNTGNNLNFSVTVAFSSSFAGNQNLFMDAMNPQGGTTGYQLEGSWTVP